MVNSVPLLPQSFTRVTSNMSRNVFINDIMQLEQAIQQTQEQLSSGNRILQPSDDPIGENQILLYQSSINQNSVFTQNIDSAKSMLSTTDTSLQTMQNLVTKAKTIALTALNSGSNDSSALSALSAQVAQMIQQAIGIGNTNFQGQNIFAGSQTQITPFSSVGGGIAYAGDNNTLNTVISQGVSAPSAVSPNSAFVVFSSDITGTNLAPANIANPLGPLALSPLNVTPPIRGATQLATLNNGQSFVPGSIRIAGTGTATINLSTAGTINDVINLINAQTPTTGVSAAINPQLNGLRLTIAVGAFTVSEVGGGTTATSLGINGSSVAGVLNGSNLNPIITTDTPVQDLFNRTITPSLPASASTFLIPAWANHFPTGFSIGATVTITSDPDAPANVGQTRTVTGFTSTTGLVTLGGVALPSALDGDETYTITSDFSGMTITNATSSNTFTSTIGAGNFAAGQTVGQLLNAINNAGVYVDARIDPSGKRLSIFSRLSGGHLTIAENGGSTAFDSGLLFDTADTTGTSLKRARFYQLNNGNQTTLAGVNLIITQKNGTQVTINLGNLNTVNDLLSAINSASATLSATVTAGNRIQITDSSVGAGSFYIQSSDGNQFVSQLGIQVPLLTITPAELTFTPAISFLKTAWIGNFPNNFFFGATVTITSDPNNPGNVGQQRTVTGFNSATGEVTLGVALPAPLDGNETFTISSTANTTTATTFAGVEVTGVFSALVNLRNALLKNDKANIQNSGGLLSDVLNNLLSSRGVVGAQETTLSDTKTHLESQNLQLQTTLSQVKGVDFAQAATQLQQQTTNLQAALTIAARILNISILDYLR